MRMLSQDFGVAIQIRLARRPAAGRQGDLFLRLAAGHMLDELPG